MVIFQGTKMPNTRGKGKTTTAKKVKSKVVAPAKNIVGKEKSDSAYEKLVKKVNAKRKAEGREEMIHSDLSLINNTPNKKGKKSGKANVVKDRDKRQNVVSAHFVEDDNVMDMSVLEQEDQEQFPSQSEDEEDRSELSEAEDPPCNDNSNRNTTLSSIG